MKNFFLILLFFLSIISCSKESLESDIVGKWKYYEFSDPDIYSDCDYESVVEFFQDGTMEDYDDCTNETTTGTYSISENILTVASDEFPIPFQMKIIALNRTTLKIEFAGETTTFKKL